MNQGADVVLVRAIVDVAVFLEFSPESLLSSDAGMEAMEQLGSTLQLMSASKRRQFLAAFRQLRPHTQAGKLSSYRILVPLWGLNGPQTADVQSVIIGGVLTDKYSIRTGGFFRMATCRTLTMA